MVEVLEDNAALPELYALCASVLHLDIAVWAEYSSDFHSLFYSSYFALLLTDSAAYALSVVDNSLAVSH